jgi:hypothetical protein
MTNQRRTERGSDWNGIGGEPVGSPPAGGHTQMQRMLAGLSYEAQLAAVKPGSNFFAPGPAADRAAVQRQVDAFTGDTAAGGLSEPAIGPDVPALPARIAHLLTPDDWAELCRLARVGEPGERTDADVAATIAHLVELLKPRLSHSDVTRPDLERYQNPAEPLAPNLAPGSSDVYWVDGCQESSYIVEAALVPLGIAVDVIERFGHRTASFPQIDRVLFHGDDLHNAAEFELVPLNVMEQYHLSMIEIASNLPLLPATDGMEGLRQIFLDALAGQSVAVPGQDEQSYEVAHTLWVERVSGEVLWALTVRSDHLQGRSLNEVLDHEVRRSFAVRKVSEWAGRTFALWFAEYRTLLERIRPPNDGVPTCGREGMTLHVSPTFVLADSDATAVDMLVRLVEAMAVSGAVAGELIPDADRRQAARRADAPEDR